jgi:hypothetical protein
LLVSLVALFGCGTPEEPLPLPPPAPPAPPVVSQRTVGRLQAEYDEAHARLVAYRKLPVCLPAGPVECRDPVREQHMVQAEIIASSAMRSLRRSRESARAARDRIEAFGAMSEHLPGGSK